VRCRYGEPSGKWIAWMRRKRYFIYKEEGGSEFI